MPDYSPSPKHAIRRLLGSNAGEFVDEGIAAVVEDFEEIVATYSQGTEAALPPAGTEGKLYRARDTKRTYYDDGTEQELIADVTRYAAATPPAPVELTAAMNDVVTITELLPSGLWSVVAVIETNNTLGSGATVTARLSAPDIPLTTPTRQILDPGAAGGIRTSIFIDQIQLDDPSELRLQASATAGGRTFVTIRAQLTPVI